MNQHCEPRATHGVPTSPRTFDSTGPSERFVCASYALHHCTRGTGDCRNTNQEQAKVCCVSLRTVVSTGFHEFHSAFAEVLQKRLDLFRQCVNLSDLCHANSADADASPPHAIALPSRRCTTQCEQSACLRRCDPCQRLTELIVLRQRWHKNASANEAAATAQGYNIHNLVSCAHRQAPSQSKSARGTRWVLHESAFYASVRAFM